ncbi:MAG: helix-turn-helix domain-containing protein [Lachnospiraceae bacterium]|nr:helix-turn-helix domain-containing protein [Lachnospiraceae bacterium]
MGYSELFSMRIKQLCRKQGITINRLALLCGLKQSTIDNIIHGASKNPKIKTLHKIANAFSMTLSEFMDFPEMNDYDPEEDDPV